MVQKMSKKFHPDSVYTFFGVGTLFFITARSGEHRAHVNGA